jgi:hypothetical protein
MRALPCRRLTIEVTQNETLQGVLRLLGIVLTRQVRLAQMEGGQLEVADVGRSAGMRVSNRDHHQPRLHRVPLIWRRDSLLKLVIQYQIDHSHGSARDLPVCRRIRIPSV